MHDTITQRLQELIGLDQAAAASLARTILAVLTEQLPLRDRSSFVGKLPPASPRPTWEAGQAPGDSLALFYERVAARAGLPAARAVEASQVVCAALAELLDADSRRWLTARLPAELIVLLEPHEHPARAPESPHAQRRYPTLAEGRPGSKHPLSEAHWERAQHDSVARSDNPHGDTKLASSPGPTQSRENETLAEGDPRPERPLGTGKE